MDQSQGEMSAAEALPLTVSWSGKVFHITLDSTDSVATLKRHLTFETLVQAERQKLMLKDKAGKPVTDATPLSEVKLPGPGGKIMMLGSLEADISKAEAMAAQAPEVQDDFDVDDGAGGTMRDLTQDPIVLQKLQRRINSVEVKVLEPPRPGKGLLVLDIDYTIFDLNGTAERPEELARPYLHDFLRETYKYFDIVIWSATSMKWVEVKMRELGVLGADDWKVTCMLDHQAMLTVTTERYGTFDCKPLQFLWSKFRDFYSPKNTLMLDDLGRNFVMNPANGHKIKPYRKYIINRESDDELFWLSKYICHLGASGVDISTLKHRNFKRYLVEKNVVKKRPHPDSSESGRGDA